MAKESNKKNVKDKKSFGKGFKAELKKVVWPTTSELFKSTLAVLAIVVVISAIVFCLDFVFESMNKYGIDKIKEAVQTTEENTVVEGNTITEENTENTTNNDVENNIESTNTETTSNTVENNVQE